MKLRFDIDKQTEHVTATERKQIKAGIEAGHKQWRNSANSKSYNVSDHHGNKLRVRIGTYATHVLGKEPFWRYNSVKVIIEDSLQEKKKEPKPTSATTEGGVQFKNSLSKRGIPVLEVRISSLSDIKSVKNAPKIDSNNFYKNTAANWKKINTEDVKFVSEYNSDSGSSYMYTEDGVYRLADHWSFGVASCSWILDGQIYGYGLGFSKWEDFKVIKTEHGYDFGIQDKLYEMIAKREYVAAFRFDKEGMIAIPLTEETLFYRKENAKRDKLNEISKQLRSAGGGLLKQHGADVFFEHYVKASEKDKIKNWIKLEKNTITDIKQINEDWENYILKKSEKKLAKLKAEKPANKENTLQEPKQRFGPVMLKSRSSIIVQPQRFQGRETDFSGDTVRAIVAKGFYDKSASPIKVWWDNLLDKYVVLAGHSRMAAFDKLVEQGKARGPVPVIEFKGDEDDATDYAIIESNRKSTEEGLISDLSAYRRALKQGKSRKYLLSIFKPESKIAKLQKLSHLNPKGRFIELLSGTSAQSFPYLERNAQWIGDMRSQLPQLTDAHELELFKFIYDSGKGLKLDKTQLYKVVNDRVNRIDFDASAPLNLANRVSSNAYTDPINDQIAAITKEIEAAKREIDTKRETIARAKTTFSTSQVEEKLKITAPIIKRIDDLNRLILRKVEEREVLKQKAGKLERTMTDDLFSVVDPPYKVRTKPVQTNLAKAPKRKYKIGDRVGKYGAANPKLGAIAEFHDEVDSLYWVQFDGEPKLRLYHEDRLEPSVTKPKKEPLQEKVKRIPHKVESESGHFYVTNIYNDDVHLLLGPFKHHQDAINAVPIIEKYARDNATGNAAKKAIWGAFGTTRFKDGDTLGGMNKWFAEYNPMQVQPSAKKEVKEVLISTSKMSTYDKLKEIERQGGVFTGEKRNEDESELRLVPVYSIGVVADGETFTEKEVSSDVFYEIDEAIHEAKKLDGDFIDDTDNANHYFYVKADLVEVWFDTGGDPDEKPERVSEIEEIHWDNKYKEIIPKNIDWDVEVYRKDFGGIEDDATSLIEQIESNILNDVDGESIKVQGYDLDVVWKSSKSYVKYTSISVEYEGDVIGSINVRIADHSYNPRNVSDTESFFSITVAQNDATEDRFHGSHNLSFKGEDSYDDVKIEVVNKIYEIIDGWDIEERITEIDGSDEKLKEIIDTEKKIVFPVKQTNQTPEVKEVLISTSKKPNRTPVKRWSELQKNEVVIINYEDDANKSYALMFRNKGNFTMKNGRVHPHSTLGSVYKPTPQDQTLVNELIEGVQQEQYWSQHPQYNPTKPNKDLARIRAKAFVYAQAQRLRLSKFK